MLTFETDHPDNLFCPICGCDKIYYWPALKNWKKFSKKKKKEFEKCPACLYGTKDFPYNEFD